jgi:hypoxanthine phosphoribosyltransferase
MGLEMKCKLVSWDEVVQMCKILSSKIEADNYVPHTIIGLARSGFVPSRLLSDMLGITDLVALKVEHWLDTTGEHREEATIPYKIPFRIEGRKVLVVDDIVDTGKSMNISVEYLRQFKPSQLKTAVMQYITASEHIPDYYAVKIEDWTWFIYPWNLYEDLGNLSLKLLKASRKPLKIEEFKAEMLKKFSINVELEVLKESLIRLERKGKIVRDREGWKPV